MLRCLEATRENLIIFLCFGDVIADIYIFPQTQEDPPPDQMISGTDVLCIRYLPQDSGQNTPFEALRQ